MTREVVQIVEIKQPFCSLFHGTSPCTATETGDDKCFNTRSTCNDTDNFDLSSFSLYFSKGNIGNRKGPAYLTDVDGAFITDVDGAFIITESDWPTYTIPSLVSVSTVPARINIAGADDDAKPIGMRASCNIVFQDHPARS